MDRESQSPGIRTIPDGKKRPYWASTESVLLTSKHHRVLETGADSVGVIVMLPCDVDVALENVAKKQNDLERQRLEYATHQPQTVHRAARLYEVALDIYSIAWFLKQASWHHQSGVTRLLVSVVTTYILYNTALATLSSLSIGTVIASKALLLCTRGETIRICMQVWITTGAKAAWKGNTDGVHMRYYTVSNGLAVCMKLPSSPLFVAASELRVLSRIAGCARSSLPAMKATRTTAPASQFMNWWTPEIKIDRQKPI